MKTSFQFSKFVYTAALCTMISLSTIAQVKIGDSPTVLNANALLELQTTNRGFLMPRVGLTGTGNVTPLSAHVAGMTVYNTATTGDVTPGVYYNDGTKWVRFINTIPATVSGTEFNLSSSAFPYSDATSDKTSSIFRTGDLRIGALNGGSVVVSGGGLSNSGYIGFYDNLGTKRLGYIGWDNTNLTYVTENSAKHVFNGGDVGIGIVPTAPLHLYRSGLVYELIQSGNGGIADLGIANSGGDGIAGTVAKDFWLKSNYNMLLGTSTGYDAFILTNNAKRITVKGAGTSALNGVSSAGYVGINNTNPQAPLHVTYNGYGYAAIIENTNNGFQGGTGAWASSQGLLVKAGVNGAVGTSGGNLIAFQRPDGTNLGAVVVNASYTGVEFGTTSDARLKENIVPTKFSLADLNKIKIVDYNFIGSSYKTTGVLAQDLHKIYPDAVSVGGDNAKTNPWTVDYGKLTPLLVKALQDQQAEIELLKKQVESLLNKK